MTSIFDAALEHHRHGRLDPARKLYLEVLSQNPRHADSLHLLGVLANQVDRPDLAVDLISAAIACNAAVPAYHVNLGNALRALRRHDAAIAAFRAALDIDSALTDAHLNLAAALADQNRLAEAAECLRDAVSLRPERPDLHLMLGDCLREQHRLAEAATCYRRARSLDPTDVETLNKLGWVRRQEGCAAEAVQHHLEALALRPGDPQSCNHLGTALMAQGRFDEAASAYAGAIRGDPTAAEPCYNLGNLLVEMGRPEQAVAWLRAALERKPDFTAARYNLGNALRLLGQVDEAARCFAHVLDETPDLAEAHNNAGILLRDDGRYDEAIACFRRALSLQPDFADALNNLGNALNAQGHVDEALASLRQAVRLKPDFADAHQNLGMALLAAGDFTAGWPEYEWRWQTSQMRGSRAFAVPQWRGEPGRGRTLLIHAEQGFGDTLQFCRFAPLASARDLRVVLEVPASLVRLLEALPGIERVIASGAERPSFDLHCPMLSLPLALATTLDTIPRSPYLSPRDEDAVHWRGRLGPLVDRGLRVGLVWAGNPRRQSPALAALDRRRSVPPENLAPLFDIPGLHLVSLQKDGPAAPAGAMLTDLMDEMRDFADTAALIDNLDLVISVDTAVAHLAAALGTPVWLLDRFDPCWRWLRGRRDSPWYPTLRIYRQSRPGDWRPVIDEVARDLRLLSPQTTSQRSRNASLTFQV